MLELLQRITAEGGEGELITSCWRFDDISPVIRLAERLTSALKGYNTILD